MHISNIIKSTSLLAIVACLLWSSAFVGIKIGLQYTSPLAFAGIRFFLSGCLLFPFIKGFKTIIKDVKENPVTILKIAFYQTFLLYALFYWGVSMAGAALSAIVIGSQPLFAALVAHYMQSNDKMSMRKFLSIGLGIIGVVVISYDKIMHAESGSNEIWGILLLVVANISSGIGNVYVAKAKKSISALSLNATQLAIGGLALYFISMPLEGIQFSIKPIPYYNALTWLSFLSAAAFSLWFVLLQRPKVKVSDLNVWKFIIPVFGAILSWVILPDEQPDLISIMGMLIIGFSLLLLHFTTRKLNKV